LAKRLDGEVRWRFVGAIGEVEGNHLEWNVFLGEGHGNGQRRTDCARGSVELEGHERAESEEKEVMGGKLIWIKAMAVLPENAVDSCALVEKRT
jgi:hypothetical protein